MNNFTTNCYEMKREIANFSKKMSKNLSKPTKKFVMDLQYGISKGGSCLVSDIARALNDNIKLKNVIERICDNLANLGDEEKETIEENYLNEVKKYIDKDNTIAIFDDSDINKEYSKKLEDLDRVIDASSLSKKVVNGYHVCEAVLLTKNQQQPISVYSKIYSCKSNDFISKNEYTFASIKRVESVVGSRFTGLFDRGYDDNKIIDYMSKDGRKMVIRLNDRRTLLFKGKKKSIEEIAGTRKGKIVYKALFDDNEEVELTISYTRATLPYNNKEYNIVIIYGLSDEKPMKLITNITFKDKKDIIKIVRLYLSRWRIEEHFRGKKQEYDFENMRVRTLKSMNNLNMMLSIHLGHIAMLADHINRKLLSIKIIYASESLKNTAIVWLSQMAKGIKAMLKFAHTGIQEWRSKTKSKKENYDYEQLALDL